MKEKAIALLFCYLTMSEAAAMYQIPAPALYVAYASGELRGNIDGKGVLLFEARDVAEFVAKSATTPKADTNTAKHCDWRDVKIKIKKEMVKASVALYKTNSEPVFIDGKFYRSIFTAGSFGNVSFQYLCKVLKKTGGSPTLMKIKHSSIVSLEWITKHKEWLEQ